MWVAAGILTSRLLGLLRSRLVAHVFGVGPHVDVLNMALRAPNFLQNLLGEGTLSAAFIPIYSRMLHAGKQEEASRFAGAVLGLLAAAAGGLALLGVLLARPLTTLLAYGFKGDAGAVDRFELTVQAVRIIFPMTALLVLSAWALGVLNSHRRFFLPYVAPAVWNVGTMSVLVLAGGLAGGPGRDLAGLDRLLFAACWGALLGGALQLLIQLPSVLRLLGRLRVSLSPKVPGVGEAIAAFGPVVAGRGVVQLSGYFDFFLAGFLATGAVAALGYAQTLYLLPISLFGMSVAAAELPELARMSAGGSGGDGVSAGLAERVRRSLAQMGFVNAATLVGYLAFGLLLVGLLFQTGSFGRADAWLVYLVLAGYTLGLLASTSSRLLQNTFYALGEPRVPARIATQRVLLSALAGIPLMLLLDRFTVAMVSGEAAGHGLKLGAAGLALASAGAAWFELFRLWRALARRGLARIVPFAALARMLGVAVAAALPAAGLWAILPRAHVAVAAAAVLGLYGLVYLALGRWLCPEELALWWKRLGNGGKE